MSYDGIGIKRPMAKAAVAANRPDSSTTNNTKTTRSEESYKDSRMGLPNFSYSRQVRKAATESDINSLIGRIEKLQEWNSKNSKCKALGGVLTVCLEICFSIPTPKEGEMPAIPRLHNNVTVDSLLTSFESTISVSETLEEKIADMNKLIADFKIEVIGLREQVAALTDENVTMKTQAVIGDYVSNYLKKIILLYEAKEYMSRETAWTTFKEDLKLEKKFLPKGILGESNDDYLSRLYAQPNHARLLFYISAAGFTANEYEDMKKISKERNSVFHSDFNYLPPNEQRKQLTMCLDQFRDATVEVPKSFVDHKPLVEKIVNKLLIENVTKLEL